MFSQEKITSIFNYKQFQTPNKGTYIESYLLFVSSSLTYKSPKYDNLQSRLLVTQIFKKDDSIVNFLKYKVLGPELKDSIAVDFKDVKRIFLEPGEYKVEIIIQDLVDSNLSSISSESKLTVRELKKKIQISDVELVDYIKKTGKNNEFTKSGYDIYPMVSNYLSSEVEKLSCYFELYNSKPTEKVLVKQYIETFYTNKLLPKYIKYSSKVLKEVTPIINVFAIQSLPSGNYNFVVELRDSSNELIDIKKTFIQRVNKKILVEQVKNDETNTPKVAYSLYKDSIDFFMESLLPIASRLESKVLENNKEGLTQEQKENYFIHFWESRYGVTGIEEWRKYKNLVYIAEKKFGTRIKHAFETDMGRVFLKYGKPNDVIDKPNEQGAYPYAIWHYYKTERKSNVQFVFYKTTSVAGDYELIHSNMTGEIFNREWKYLINRRVGGGDSRLNDDENRMR